MSDEDRRPFLEQIADLRLSGGGSEYLVTREAFGAILELAEEHGWVPQQEDADYASLGFEVSAWDANELGNAVDVGVTSLLDADDDEGGILDANLLLKENADALLQFVAFCRNGAFKVYWTNS